MPSQGEGMSESLNSHANVYYRIGQGRQVDYFLSYREALCPDILSVVSRSLLWDLGKSMSELLRLGFSVLSDVYKLLSYLPLCEATMTKPFCW